MDWQAGWGRGLWSLANAEGLLQGLISGLTLVPALEMQVGMAEQDWAIPSPSSLGRGGFQSFEQGSPGQLWAHSASLGTSEASARQMGHVRLAFNHLSTHLVWNS